jgi:hypothetical protein
VCCSIRTDHPVKNTSMTSCVLTAALTLQTTPAGSGYSGVINLGVRVG